MKNIKSVAMGFVAGALCMVSATAFAAANGDITVKLFNDVTFKFDGVRTASPSDQPVLNYNGYAYVPIRYVSETLGADVNWDIPTRTIDIQSDKRTYVKEVEVEKIVYVKEGDENYDEAIEDAKKINYEALPVRSRKNDHILEFTGVSRDEDSLFTKLFLNLENKNEFGCQVVPGESTLIIDGEEVSRHELVRLWDDSWSTSDIDYDEEHEGFLLFKLIDEEWETGTLKVVVRSNSDGKEETHTFNFKQG